MYVIRYLFLNATWGGLCGWACSGSQRCFGLWCNFVVTVVDVVVSVVAFRYTFASSKSLGFCNALVILDWLWS